MGTVVRALGGVAIADQARLLAREEVELAGDDVVEAPAEVHVSSP